MSKRVANTRDVTARKKDVMSECDNCIKLQEHVNGLNARIRNLTMNEAVKLKSESDTAHFRLQSAATIERYKQRIETMEFQLMNTEKYAQDMKRYAIAGFLFGIGGMGLWLIV